MDQVEELEIAYKLLGILQAYAPTGTAQQRCADWYNNLQKEGVTAGDIVIALTGCIRDGKMHGNWPWILDPEGRY